LSRQPHAVFVYGYEVVRWGGPISRFVMPNVGGMPIHHTKIDRKGMMRIDEAIANGPYPVAIAPEGQVSYTAESVPRLEQGTFRIGFMAADKMQKQGIDIPVEVLPVSIHFRFGVWGKLALEKMIKRIEKYSNINSKETKNLPFGKRIEPCREHILSVNEKHYNIPVDKNIPFEERLSTLINIAMETGERILGMKSEGDYFTRLYSLRQNCWDLIFLPGVDSLKKMSLLERNAADLKAGEAWHASRHMERADFGWYFRIPIPKDDAPLHEKVEYCQNLWDFASRTMGGGYSNRKNILPRKVVIQTSPPMNLTERLPAYKQDRKTAISDAMADLEKAYMDSIEAINKSDKYGL
jgi:1-acyl-sn-glycerol-3-phosphate acyltransferase